MNRRRHQKNEQVERSSSVMLGCIAGEGKRPGKYQEQKILGEKKVN